MDKIMAMLNISFVFLSWYIFFWHENNASIYSYLLAEVPIPSEQIVPNKRYCFMSFCPQTKLKDLSHSLLLQNSVHSHYKERTITIAYMHLYLKKTSIIKFSTTAWPSTTFSVYFFLPSFLSCK